jgi:hypothetical protein
MLELSDPKVLRVFRRLRETHKFCGELWDQETTLYNDKALLDDSRCNIDNQTNLSPSTCQAHMMAQWAQTPHLC